MIHTPIAKQNPLIKSYRRNVDALVANAYNLIMQAQVAGSFIVDGHTPTDAEVEISRKARLLVHELEQTLRYCKEEDIPDLLDAYDAMYRIGYSEMPDSLYIKRLQERFLDAWGTGNKNIAESQVYNILSQREIMPNIHNTNHNCRELKSIRTRWVNTLKKYNRFPDVTSYENYQRLALLMQDNLDEYFSGDASTAKQSWYENNRIDDFTSLPSRLLRSYRRFVASLFPAVMDFDENQVLDARILQHLSLTQSSSAQ